MANGGIFLLLTNDGKQDRMLMASELLEERIKIIRQKRAAQGLEETPTLLDIEKTHVLYTNAHFKPFVAIGFEYAKVNIQSGNLILGGEVTFSIPQFGDFFADMVMYVNIAAPTVSTTETVDAKIPTVQWCNYPGERFSQETRFEVNGNPLDKYSDDCTVVHRHMFVQPNKQTAWKKCMGQEIEKDAYIPYDAASAPGDYYVRQKITDGNQTPKQSLPALEMFIPFLFWFCKDVRLAIPSVAIPNGMRFITVKTATKDQMIGTTARGGGSLPTVSEPVITNMTLYINNIFTNPEVHQIFMKRVGFSLIRVYKYQTQAVSLAENEILLQQLKWPIEALFVGFKPTTQATSPVNWDKFTYITTASKSVPGRVASITVPTHTAAPTTPYADTTALLAAANAGSIPIAASTTTLGTLTVTTPTKLVDRISITAHGIALYNDLPEGFFSSYTQYQYGGHNINASSDPGLMMIPFCLYPGSYQPSGHLNASRAREFYIKYHSTLIGTTVLTATMFVLASAINFLLISEGSATLRYST